MSKYIVTITDEEIMQELAKSRSTYYLWKKNKPKEYKLIEEVLILRKFDFLIRNN